MHVEHFFYCEMYTQPQNFKKDHRFRRHLLLLNINIAKNRDHNKFLFLLFIFRILILCSTVLRIVHTVLHCSCVSHLQSYICQLSQPFAHSPCKYHMPIQHCRPAKSTMSNAHVNQFDIEASSKRRRCMHCK